MNKLYAVVFDNDEMYPGVMQFCSVGNDEEHLQACETNLTHDKVYAESVTKERKKYWPDYNYRVVEIVMKEVEVQQFLTDVVTAAGLLSHGKTDKALARRISEFAYKLM